MNLVFKAMTSDVISEYALGESDNNLGKEDLNATFFSGLAESTSMVHIQSFFPWMGPLMELVPPIAVKANPAFEYMFEVLNVSALHLVRRATNIVRTNV